MPDNTDMEAKVAVREWALHQAGGKKARVLELFGGKGVMRDTVYGKVADHRAFDLRDCEKGTWLQGDNRVLLQKHVNGWTLYDADAYINPWIILTDVCRLRKPGKFAMVATCGMRRGMLTGDVSEYFRWVSGYGLLVKCPIIWRYYYDMLDAVFRQWRGYGVQLIAARVTVNRTYNKPYHYFYYAFSARKG